MGSIPRHGSTYLKSQHSTPGGGGRRIRSEIQSYPRLLRHEFEASTKYMKPCILHLIKKGRNKMGVCLFRTTGHLLFWCQLNLSQLCQESRGQGWVATGVTRILWQKLWTWGAAESGADGNCLCCSRLGGGSEAKGKAWATRRGSRPNQRSGSQGRLPPTQCSFYTLVGYIRVRQG